MPSKLHRRPRRISAPSPLRSLIALTLAASLAACATGPASPDRGPAEKAVSLRIGDRAPAIVLQSGLGDGKAVWTKLLAALPPGYTVIAFDRPGYGDNPARAAPRDPCTIAAEQRALLQAAGIKPPYLLVGHSLGGLYQYVHARLYPSEVAGLVLLDPTHPRHWASMQREAPAAAALVKVLRTVSFSDTERREFDGQTDCLDRLTQDRPIPQPVRILVSGRFRPEEKGEFVTMLQRLRREWLALTGAQRLDVVLDSGHHLQKDAPEEVAAAIRSVAGDTLPGVLAPHGDAAAPGLFVPGQSRREDVRAALGEPTETLAGGDREFWVYGDRLDIPFFVSFIPLLGDIADAAELLQGMRTNHELIVEFNQQGVVNKVRRRETR